MDWHAVLFEQTNRRKLWFPESKVTFNPSLFGGSFHISMIRRSIWASALPPFTARVVVPNASAKIPQ